MKMTELYLVRHCEAEGNVKRFIQGVIDTDITTMGEKQLVHLGERFKDIDIDLVLASPLKRTIATAHAIADQKGLNVIKKDGFIEMNCGVYECFPFEKAFANKDFAYMWNNRPQDFAPEDGETQPQVYERIWNAVLQTVSENKGKRIAVATHGGVLRCLLCRLLFGDLEYLSQVPYGFNTAVTLLRFDDDMNPELVFYNDDTHLPPDCIPEDSRVPDVAEEQ